MNINTAHSASAYEQYATENASKKHKSHKKEEAGSEQTSELIKEDTVQISEEAKQRCFVINQLSESQLQNIEKNIRPLIEAKEAWMRESFMNDTDSIQYFLINALEGKVEDALRATWQLSGMIYSTNGNADMETKAMDREAGKKIAEYIAENYFDKEEEAQAFIDTINKYVGLSEKEDESYNPYPNLLGAKTSFERLQDILIRQVEMEKTFAPLNVDVIYQQWREKLVKTDWNTLSANYEDLKDFLCNANGYEDFYKHLINYGENRAWYAENEKATQAVQVFIDNAKEYMSNVTVDDDFISKYSDIFANIIRK